MSITLNDIAERAGVSVSTVSRVLNSKGEQYRISAKTIERIFLAAKDLKYRPNQIARGLRLKKTNTLGLIAPDISNPFFAQIIKQAQKTAYDLGYSLVVCNTDENLDMEIAHVNLLYRNRVDGLLAMPVGTQSKHFVEWLERPLPLVLLDRGFEDLKTNTVLVDNYYGASVAIEHFIRNGHERIAIIQGLPGTYTTNARLRGYRDTLEKHGLKVDENLIVGGDFRQENGYIETKLLLNMENPPTAIFATSDLITLGVLEAIEEEGKSIPDDMSIIAFDDLDVAPFLKCPLTAVRQPKEMMGELAMKMLIEDVKNGRQETKSIVLKPTLVIRNSVRFLHDPAVSLYGPRIRIN